MRVKIHRKSSFAPSSEALYGVSYRPKLRGAMGAGAPATRRCGACVGADQRLGRSLRSGRVQILMR